MFIWELRCSHLYFPVGLDRSECLTTCESAAARASDAGVTSPDPSVTSIVPRVAAGAARSWSTARRRCLGLLEVAPGTR